MPLRSASCHNCGKKVTSELLPLSIQGSHPRVKEGNQHLQARSAKGYLRHSGTRGCRGHIPVNTRSWGTGQPLEVQVTIIGQPLWMELDTAAAVSLVSKRAYNSVFPDCTVQSSNTQLRTYLGALLTVMDVRYGDQQVDAPIFVVEGGASLSGKIG